jgi:hypothetical protein
VPASTRNAVSSQQGPGAAFSWSLSLEQCLRRQYFFLLRVGTATPCGLAAGQFSGRKEGQTAARGTALAGRLLTAWAVRRCEPPAQAAVALCSGLSAWWPGGLAAAPEHASPEALSSDEHGAPRPTLRPPCRSSGLADVAGRCAEDASHPGNTQGCGTAAANPVRAAAGSRPAGCLPSRHRRTMPAATPPCWTHPSSR